MPLQQPLDVSFVTARDQVMARIAAATPTTLTMLLKRMDRPRTTAAAKQMMRQRQPLKLLPRPPKPRRRRRRRNEGRSARRVTAQAAAAATKNLKARQRPKMEPKMGTQIGVQGGQREMQARPRAAAPWGVFATQVQSPPVAQVLTAPQVAGSSERYVFVLINFLLIHTAQQRMNACCV